jgi:lipopolysaccharide/colanic/teichoic acid biosynthesis glycosyltransferase
MQNTEGMGRPSEKIESDQKSAICEAPVVKRFAYRVIKRAIDFLGAGIGLIFLFPFLFVIAILVKLTSPGPIFYPWNVIGCGGKFFRGYKFRTMVENADEMKAQLLTSNEMTGPVFKMKNDPRVTLLGRFLRKYSFDELPQLWSVLKGDMSLVGPRPAGTHEWINYEPWQQRKLSVTPGITCLWQVVGRNKIKDFDDWVKLDLEYIDHWSLWVDMKILLCTVVVVFRGTGV